MNNKHFFQLIRYGTNSESLIAPYEDVWKDSCPEDRKSDLEHLLLKIKEKRDLSSHKNVKILNLTDRKIEFIINETKSQISNIIKQAGKKAKRDPNEVKNVNDGLEKHIENIRLKKFISSCEMHDICELLKKEDMNAHLAALDKYFSGELKGFTAPKFYQRQNNSIKISFRQ